MNAKINVNNMPNGLREALLLTTTVNDAMDVFDAWSRNFYVDTHDRIRLLADLRKANRNAN